jgi:hypothetical protein
MIIVALFCLHGSIEAMWPFEAQAVSTLKSKVQCLASPLVQKTVQYIKEHPSKVAAITLLGVAALTAFYLLRSDDLSMTDPEKFCNWAEKQLNDLDSQTVYLRQATKYFWIKRRIRNGYELTSAMRLCFFDIGPRVDDQPYERMRGTYQNMFKSAPFLEGSEGVFKVLGLRPDANFKEAKRALEIWANEVESHKEAVDYTQRFAALRQLTYIVGTPFGWANYCAYARGHEAVEQLPLGVDKVRVEQLTERVMSTRFDYEELLRSK